MRLLYAAVALSFVAASRALSTRRRDDLDPITGARAVGAKRVFGAAVTRADAHVLVAVALGAPFFMNHAGLQRLS